MTFKKLPSFAGHARGFLTLMLVGISTSYASVVTTNLVFTVQPVSASVGAPMTNVVVQIRDSRGTNISQAGSAILLVLSKGIGLTGITNVITDASGKAVFTDLAIAQVGNGDTLQTSANNFKSVTSGTFNIAPGKTTNALVASSNPVVYGQLVTLTSIVSVIAPSSGLPAGTVTFKDGTAVLGTLVLNASGQAHFSATNHLSAGLHNITVVYAGSTNFATSTSVVLPLTVSRLPLTVSGIMASNKIYDSKTTATINLSHAAPIGILSGDNVTLNTNSAKGTFADKNVGAGKVVSITGLTIAGTNVGNYLLTLPVATASISAARLTVTAKGVNKIYDGTTSTTVSLADNRIAGDVLTDAYASAAFTNKNIGTAKLVSVSGLSISGNDSPNYALAVTNTTAMANITAAALTVSGITASNKVYNATTTAGLDLAGVALVGVSGGDSVALVKTNAKGLFANKNIGTAKTVTISGLTISGVDAGNYTLAQPASTAGITAANLTVAAKGVSRLYDGTTAAIVTLSDNRFNGDVLTVAYASAAFSSSQAGTGKTIAVTGVIVSGTDSANYLLQNTNVTTTANITAAPLLVTANNLSRPFGMTNPPLTYAFSGFVNGETTAATTGKPALTTTAKTNSAIGNYPITIAKGTLAAVDYTFVFSNGTLLVNPVSTAALVTSGLNPARTSQNISFATKVSALNPGVSAPTGQVRLKSNGTNVIAGPVNLTNGTTTLVIPAAALGSGSVVVTAEYSDPAGNFIASTNSISQTIVLVTPGIGKVSITPPRFDGSMQATLSGTPGQTFVLEASSDLVHWTPISTNVADTNGFISIVESNAVAYPSRYYRGMMP